MTLFRFNSLWIPFVVQTHSVISCISSFPKVLLTSLVFAGHTLVPHGFVAASCSILTFPYYFWKNACGFSGDSCNHLTIWTSKTHLIVLSRTGNIIIYHHCQFPKDAFTKWPITQEIWFQYFVNPTIYWHDPTTGWALIISAYMHKSKALTKFEIRMHYTQFHRLSAA